MAAALTALNAAQAAQVAQGQQMLKDMKIGAGGSGKFDIYSGFC